MVQINHSLVESYFSMVLFTGRNIKNINKSVMIHILVRHVLSTRIAAIIGKHSKYIVQSTHIADVTADVLPAE